MSELNRSEAVAVLAGCKAEYGLMRPLMGALWDDARGTGHVPAGGGNMATLTRHLGFGDLCQAKSFVDMPNPSNS